MPTAVRFGPVRDTPLSKSIEVMPSEPSAMLGSSSCKRLLLRGGMLAVWSSGSTVFGPGNSGGSLEGNASEAFGRRRAPGPFLAGTFDTFDLRTGPRDVFATPCVCPSLWGDLLLLARAVCLAAGRGTGLRGRWEGEFNSGFECSASPLANPVGSMFADRAL